MTEALVIRLKSASTSAAPAADPSSDVAAIAPSPQAEWLAVDSNGARHSNLQSGPLANAAEFAGGRKVVVFVPARTCIWPSRCCR